jgi:hypothetical protein
MWKKIWTDPVWSKVISAAILGIVGLAGSYVLNWWPAIGAWLAGALAFSASQSLVPHWAIGLVVLLALPTVLLVLIAAWGRIFPGSDEKPNPLTYTSDVFFGIRWRWSFSGHYMSDLHTFCPPLRPAGLPRQRQRLYCS